MIPPIQMRDGDKRPGGRSWLRCVSATTVSVGMGLAVLSAFAPASSRLAVLVLALLAWAAVPWIVRQWQQFLLGHDRQPARQANEGQAVTQQPAAMSSLPEELKATKARLEQQTSTLQAENVKLKELAALKDEFVAKVSHELRTPLSSIKEGLSLILDGALGVTTADQQEFVRTMDGEVDRLAELVNNMLDISKIEAGRMRLFRARVDLRALVESLMRSYQSILGHRTVRIEGATEVPPVFADSNRMLQVLTNLFSNAVKFTPDDGTILFRIEPRDRMVAVTVKDNGPGVASEDVPKLFQKFSQVGPKGSGSGRGTGLGLVVCKELTELHGGRIDVASEMGRGTAFTVLLPVYTDIFALRESFRELLELAPSKGELAGGVVAIQVEALLHAASERDQRHAVLERVADDVRRFLHHGDLVLTLAPSWVAVLAETDARGLRDIVNRLRGKLRDTDRLRFGVAVYPTDGLDAETLFAQARCTLDQGLASVEWPSAGEHAVSNSTDS